MPRLADSLASRALSRLRGSLRGRYRIDRLIGVGGMAAVYAGRHRNGHPVAIKILHEGLAADPEVERLFRREAQLANTIGHPGVVPVIDDDVTEDGCIFLVMPLLVGETLRARAERHEGRKLSATEVVVVAHAVLGALEAAHAKKIVHRDIKPENIFLTSTGEVRVLDFGIGRFFETNDSASATRSGRAVGTPAFMAPEQALGRTREVNVRTDLWAVGATMFTLLSGRLVHVAESGSETMVLAATCPPQRLVEVLPDAPDSLATVVDRALSFDRRDRWANSAAMNEALGGACLAMTGSAPSALPRLAVPSSALSETDRELTDLAPLVPPVGTGADLFNAATRTFEVTQPYEAGRARRRILLGTALAVTASLGAVGAMSVRSVTARSSAPMLAGGVRGSAPVLSVGPPPNEQAPAVRYLGELRTAWLDGDASRVRSAAEMATKNDPSDARAHLTYVVAAHFWPDPPARAHFRRASELRDKLEPAEAAYLEAIAPGMTVPPDFHVAVERLQRLLDSRSDDVVVRMALADMKLRLGDLEGSAQLIAALVGGPHPPGLALSRYAAIAEVRDDVATARTSYDRCLANQPGSQVCAEALVGLEMNEGKCADAERVLRKQISITPDPTAYLNLAYVLERQGASADAVSAVLDNWVRTSPEDERQRDGVQAKIMLSLMGGRLGEARREYDQLGALLQNVADDPPHFYYTRSRMTLEADVGDTKAAASTLSQYESTRDALQRDVGGEDNVSYLQAVGAEFGVVPWKKWLADRDARLARPSEVDGQLDGKARGWLQLFAIPATTPAAARDALDALPDYLPILSRPGRDYVMDAALSRVYALADRPTEALPHAERAAASCAALDDLVQFRLAEVELGDVYTRLGEKDRACAMYERVADEWPSPAGSASLTSQRARERANHVCRARVGR